MPTETLDTVSTTELDEQAINTIRFLAADAVQKAGSGHPGTAMALAPVAYLLWTRHMRYNPKDPQWFNRDRFILSAGHASILQYSMLHLTGYDLPMEEIKRFRKWDSMTPGHPEYMHTPGIETTTGPLGQGFGNGVGMAIAERYLAAHFNTDDFPVIDHYTYAICSDGDLMEGVASEAASLAGHLGLGKMVYIYDDNEISIDGDTDKAFTEDVGKRFEAYHWHVQHVDDANDLEAVDQAIRAAKEETGRPSIIVLRSHIGYGSPNKQDTADAHGSPLGEEEVKLTKKNLGWPEDETFRVPDEVYDHMRQAIDRGQRLQSEWDDLFDEYADAHPDQADAFKAWTSKSLPEGWTEALPTFEAGEKMATRKASGNTLDAMGPAIGGRLVGGSADLTGSNKTMIEGRSDFQKDNPKGQYFRFGVREHAMAASANGMVLHGGVRPYVGTFLIFSDYLRPSLRLSALMKAAVVYVFTHDSVGLGGDGPTHQPIEHLMALRAIPQFTLIRPADANETVQAWVAAMNNTDGPTGLVLTRQGVPTLDRSTYASAEGLHRGAYILSDSDGTPDVILIGTGSEVQHMVAAADTLRGEDGANVRVVSMPSWELFEQQPESYRSEVLPADVTARVSMEAGTAMGWERYVGHAGRCIGIERYGASADGNTNMEKFGFTAEHAVKAARELLG